MRILNQCLSHLKTRTVQVLKYPFCNTTGSHRLIYSFGNKF